MLTIDEIKELIDSDRTSEKKRFARTGERYYDGDNDIKKYRLFYYNSDGNLVEDKTRSNVKIPHLFFTELVDQSVQYILSGNRNGERIVLSDDNELQKYMDSYFNNNDVFMEELSECVTDCKVKGFAYIYAYKDAKDRYAFATADSMGVIEVREKDTDDGCAYVIYYYPDRIDKGHKVITRVQVWSEQDTTYYAMVDNGALMLDDSVKINPRPHILYKKNGGKEDNTYYESLGFIPFFRLDNNKKQHSSLRPIKPLIDDYDLMASSLSNNLIDFDNPIYAIKGFEGDDMSELQQNLKTKRTIGLAEGGDIDIKTIDVPYQARKEKLELDEKNIYRFGMGLNTAGLKDTSATTNIAIKAAYSLLELQCNKLEIRLKKLLRHLVRIVIEDINRTGGKGYQESDVYFKFEHVIMSNAQENAQIKLTEAQAHQVVINTIMSLANTLDDETIVKAICEELDIDYDEIKDKLPEDEEQNTVDVKKQLDGVVTTDE